MSEIGLIFSVPLSECYKNRKTVWKTIGKVNPGLEVCLIDEFDNKLGPNCAGQICVRGDQVNNNLFDFKFYI